MTKTSTLKPRITVHNHTFEAYRDDIRRRAMSSSPLISLPTNDDLDWNPRHQITIDGIAIIADPRCAILKDEDGKIRIDFLPKV